MEGGIFVHSRQNDNWLRRQKWNQSGRNLIVRVAMELFVALPGPRLFCPLLNLAGEHNVYMESEWYDCKRSACLYLSIKVVPVLDGFPLGQNW